MIISNLFKNERNIFSHIIDTFILEIYRKTCAILLKRVLSKMMYIECSIKSVSGSIQKLSVIIYKRIQRDMYPDIVRFSEHTWYVANIHDNDIILKDIFNYWEVIHVYFVFCQNLIRDDYNFLLNFFTIYK